MRVEAEITAVRGVGPQTAKLLARLGIHTVWGTCFATNRRIIKIFPESHRSICWRKSSWQWCGPCDDAASLDSPGQEVFAVHLFRE